jgi:hypothetical protein
MATIRNSWCDTLPAISLTLLVNGSPVALETESDLPMMSGAEGPLPRQRYISRPRPGVGASIPRLSNHLVLPTDKTLWRRFKREAAALIRALPDGATVLDLGGARVLKPGALRCTSFLGVTRYSAWPGHYPLTLSSVWCTVMPWTRDHVGFPIYYGSCYPGALERISWLRLIGSQDVDYLGAAGVFRSHLPAVSSVCALRMDNAAASIADARCTYSSASSSLTILTR